MTDTSSTGTTDNWPELDTALASPSIALTTFRRTGIGVTTGVSAAKIDGRYLFTTPSTTGKVKRLAHTQRVTFGAGDKRGRPSGGPTTEAMARQIMDASIIPKFRAAMRMKYPVMSRVIELRYKIKRDERLIYVLTRP